MKKIRVIMSLLLVLFLTRQSYAASATPSATPTGNEKTKLVEELKERLATKVAQLRQLERRAVAGNVKSTSVSNITIETTTKDIKIELTDDIKVIQFIKGERKTLTTDDLSKNDEVVVFGDYDVTLDLLKAKVIFIASPLPLQIHGTVTTVDAKAYTLTVQSTQGAPHIVDFERTTKTIAWNKNTGTEKIGFSKLKSGDIVHILGTAVPKKENRISALRILDIGPQSASTLSGAPTDEASSPSATTE